MSADCLFADRRLLHRGTSLTAIPIKRLYPLMCRLAISGGTIRLCGITHRAREGRNMRLHDKCWLAATLLLLAGGVAAETSRQCHNLVRATDINQAIEPGVRVAATETTPAYCHVRGVINRAIRFEVAMPDNWNGRFMFSTVGGSAGVIGDITSLLTRGFAMASTDTGHEITDGDAY
ncbi:MAG: tannase/feruloyl esterase family alpha/beta hydrolase, partial [Pseudomonadota bacterium]